MTDLIVAYCGIPPLPADIATRWNLDPWLIGILGTCAVAHVNRAPEGGRLAAVAGWLLAAAALVSPLCAASVALFSARVFQHLVLLFAAAPLVALALPRRWFGRSAMAAALCLWLILWFWHAPQPYGATFESDAMYWTMHLSLSIASVWFWAEVLHARSAVAASAAFATLALQMGLLGALLTFLAVPIYAVHAATTSAWGVTPLGDQQLGGILMWVLGHGALTAGAVAATWIALSGDYSPVRNASRPGAR